MMKTPMKIRSIIGILGLTAILLSGCYGNRVDLVDNQTVSLERVPTKCLYISSAAVYQKGNATEVRGVISRQHRGFHGHGHVDIAVLAPDGTVLEESRALYHPRTLRRKGDPHAHFTAPLSTVPPPGSTVRLSYHEDEDSSSETKPFNCEKNAACPAVKDKEE
jgi:hypothetical protein